MNISRRLAGEGSGRLLQEIRHQSGALRLTLCRGMTMLPLGDETEGVPPSPYLKFVVTCGDTAHVDACKRLLSAEFARVHEAFQREVHGSLVLRNFPASWSENSLKFVFAPFGGLVSVAVEAEEEKPSSAGADTSALRLAYLKLRTASTKKVASALHQTKVGDGDIVEECVIHCQQWHTRGWSDGTFLARIYIDQLVLDHRPTRAAPTPVDRELFVRRLPLQDMNQLQLQEYFEGFGEVEDLHLIRDTYTDQLIGEGYVRFRQHRDARRCLEALTPDGDADPNDLVGTWSESERALQRKDVNCYRFNLIDELVCSDGSGLERLKTECHLSGIWCLAETLRQRDRTSPPPSGKQLHFVGRFADEAHVDILRESLQEAFRKIHRRISDRMERRSRKAAATTGKENASFSVAAVPPQHPQGGCANALLSTNGASATPAPVMSVFESDNTAASLPGGESESRGKRRKSKSRKRHRKREKSDEESHHRHRRRRD